MGYVVRGGALDRLLYQVCRYYNITSRICVDSQIKISDRHNK